jgi:hypothetical protein
MKRRTLLFMISLALCAPQLIAFAAPHASRWDKDRLEIGSVAPDFELPLLKITTDDKGVSTGSIKDQKVKLSSLREETIAILFFSSYT